MSSNRLKINHDKTDFVWFASSYGPSGVPADDICVGGVIIKPSATARSLGVVFDNFLTFKAHVSNVISSCFLKLKQLGRLRRSIDHENLRTLLIVFVLSRLDYCNSLLAGQPESLMKRLQSVQNAAARMFSGLSRYQSVTAVLRDELHWLKISYRVTYKLCILVYRCLHGLALKYLSGSCVRLVEQSLRSSRNRAAASGNLVIPRTRLKTYGQRSFAFAGPTAWNSLPAELKNTTSLPIFKSKLKTHLFNCCYF